MGIASLVAAAVAPPACAACAAWAGRAEPLCPECRGRLRWLGDEVADAAGVAVWAAVAYDGPARDLVRALKFRGIALAAEAMGAQIAANAPPPLLAAGALVPVPLHRTRRRRRGFNQAAAIADAISRRTGMPVWDGLARGGPAATQVGRGRAQRLGGVAGSVRTARGDPPAAVVLVDDVVTTGATLAACAAALRGAGARRVAAVVYARTPGR